MKLEAVRGRGNGRRARDWIGRGALECVYGAPCVWHPVVAVCVREGRDIWVKSREAIGVRCEIITTTMVEIGLGFVLPRPPRGLDAQSDYVSTNSPK